jgi:hypothetical protein
VDIGSDLDAAFSEMERLATADLQKLTSSQLLERAAILQHGFPKVISKICELLKQELPRHIAKHAKHGRWDFVSDHIQNGGEITDELRTFLVEVLNGKRRPNNRTQSLKILQRHRRATRFVIAAVREGQSAAKAYRDASERFGLTPERIEDVCREHAPFVVSSLQRNELLEKATKALAARVRSALRAIRDELVRRGPTPRYEVSKGALTEHFITPCLLGTS